MSDPINREQSALTEWSFERLKRLEKAQEEALYHYADTGLTTYEFEDLEFNVHFVKRMLPWAFKELAKLNGETDCSCA